MLRAWIFKLLRTPGINSTESIPLEKSLGHFRVRIFKHLWSPGISKEWIPPAYGFFSQLLADFLEASRNFYFDFLHKKARKIVKNISNHKSTDMIFRTFTNLFISWHYPFKVRRKTPPALLVSSIKFSQMGGRTFASMN
jgi:hypothetical protein